MTNTDSMKLLTDIVFQKKVPSESWQEYQKDQEQSAQYHHIKYGHGQEEFSVKGTVTAVFEDTSVYEAWRKTFGSKTDDERG